MIVELSEEKKKRIDKAIEQLIIELSHEIALQNQSNPFENLPLSRRDRRRLEKAERQQALKARKRK